MYHLQHMLYLLRGIPAGLVIQLIRIHHALIGQRTHTHHEKLIQIGKINCCKFQPFKQRYIGPQCLGKASFIKFQPA